MTQHYSPGSPQAVLAGCTCPIMDNGHGSGYMVGAKGKDGRVMFVMNCTCPVHGIDAQPDEWVTNSLAIQARECDKSQE
jgi:hypothetical protein